MPNASPETPPTLRARAELARRRHKTEPARAPMSAAAGFRALPRRFLRGPNVARRARQTPPETTRTRRVSATRGHREHLARTENDTRALGQTPPAGYASRAASTSRASTNAAELPR